jgi:hypothetical protein
MSKSDSTTRASTRKAFSNASAMRWPTRSSSSNGVGAAITQVGRAASTSAHRYAISTRVSSATSAIAASLGRASDGGWHYDPRIGGTEAAPGARPAAVLTIATVTTEERRAVATATSDWAPAGALLLAKRDFAGKPSPRPASCAARCFYWRRRSGALRPRSRFRETRPGRARGGDPTGRGSTGAGAEAGQ